MGEVTNRSLAEYAEIGDGEYAYLDHSSDTSILHDIDPNLVDLAGRLSNAVTSNIPERRTFVSTDWHTKITKNILADHFGTGPLRARATLKGTLQNGRRSAILPLARRYKADRNFQVRRLAGKWATDTIYGPVKSLSQCMYMQVYSHKCGFKAVYPMEKFDGANVGKTLRSFIHEFGAPEHLTYDGHKTQVGRNTEFKKIISTYDINWHVSQPRTPRENPAESAIRELKRRWYHIQFKTGAHDRVWDFGINYVAETDRVIVSKSRYARGRTPMEIVTGVTPDISEYLDFGFWDLVLYKSNAGVGAPELGMWLGVSHSIGPEMSYWVLPA